LVRHLAQLSLILSLARVSGRGLRKISVKTLLTVFLSVFVAELGDKTQLATLLFATDRNFSRTGVFVASSAALVCSSLLAVLLGGQVARFVSPATLKVVAGLGFIMIGVWMLFDAR
jgi:putative Ca2+/H+ antiporter (TMEM165/GDT1 family)